MLHGYEAASVFSLRSWRQYVAILTVLLFICSNLISVNNESDYNTLHYLSFSELFGVVPTGLRPVWQTCGNGTFLKRGACVPGTLKPPPHNLTVVFSLCTNDDDPAWLDLWLDNLAKYVTVPYGVVIQGNTGIQRASSSFSNVLYSRPFKKTMNTACSGGTRCSVGADVLKGHVVNFHKAQEEFTGFTYFVLRASNSLLVRPVGLIDLQHLTGAGSTKEFQNLRSESILPIGDVNLSTRADSSLQRVVEASLVGAFKPASAFRETIFFLSWHDSKSIVNRVNRF
eukprot:SAG31_NODE_1595_length_7803_cov_15.169522_2_plen_284_part_00